MDSCHLCLSQARIVAIKVFSVSNAFEPSMYILLERHVSNLLILVVSYWGKADTTVVSLTESELLLANL